MIAIVRGGVVITPDRVRDGLDVLLDGSRIIGLRPAGEVTADAVIDAAGLTVVPGYVDVHVHGGGGSTLLTADAGQIRSYAGWAVRHGVTSFLIGAVAPTVERGHATIQAGRAAVASPLPGSAEILGFHFEGPFLSPARHGAFDPSSLRLPDPNEFHAYLAAAGPLARLMTIAPELTGAEAVIRLGVAAGVRMSMGHTNATVEEARAGFTWGITHVTHCFNAMRPFGHRDPGPIGAALTASGVTCELIGDTIHVHRAAMELLLRAKGPDDTVLVTDGIELAGIGDGTFQFGRRAVSIRDGIARLGDGTIAGSITTMDENVRNVVALGIPLQDAVRMASANPSRVAGATHKGAIASGMDADLVLLDRDLRVRMTIVRGAVAYKANA